ncbi:MAG: FHA domain-containing protein [Deltaproteobacteria bacterium]|nr:FHA domain-containing protein [Deltaproteobacteria bacterium]
MKSKAVVIYNNPVNAPPLHEEEARLEIVSGPEEGTLFQLVGGQVKLGRHSDNDIILKDLKASRFHAVIEKKHGHFIVRDLESQNGIYVNNQRVVESELSAGDFLSIGQVVLKYSENIHKPVPHMPPHLGIEESKKKNIKAALLVGVFILLALFFISIYFKPDVNQPITREPSQKMPPPTLFGEDFKTPLESSQTPLSSTESAENLYFKGEREFLDGNYERAIYYLKACLGLYPGHPLAQLYLQKSFKALDEEVKQAWEVGNLYLTTLEFDLAYAEFKRVVEILEFNPDSKLFNDYYHASKHNLLRLKENR